MYSTFQYAQVPLSSIDLDLRNPRIVTQTPLTTQDDILAYFFEHEHLADFLKKIAAEGKNIGAERPYVIKSGKRYVVVEGNTRIATYKLLCGQLKAPPAFQSAVPHIPAPVKALLRKVDVTIAPSRDALLPIMASAHFGLGDKSRWGYLGSRKAVHDEWKSGRSIDQLATAFDKKPGQIRDFLIEYDLYLEALKLNWTAAELQALTRPDVEFNPPVRFLQSSGHKDTVGIELDRTNISVTFKAADSKDKFKHLIRRLVVDQPGLKATSSYAEVFASYSPQPGTQSTSGTPGTGQPGSGQPQGTGGAGSGNPGASSGGSGAGGSGSSKLSKGALFNYPVTKHNALLKQLMKEAARINSENLPAAGTALLRSLMEAILKQLIHEISANPQKKMLSLESAIDLCLSQQGISADDKKILKEFKNNHLDYVNMGAHAAVVPNHLRLMTVRDSVDQFVMRNI